jgi:hypothetical protein
MSCETNSSRIAKLACRVGIPRLAGKRGFYLGVAAGTAAMVGGLALVGLSRAVRARSLAQAIAGARARLRRAYQRLARPGPRPAPALIDLRQVPELPARQAIVPTPRDRLAGKQCAGCGSSPGGKPGPWYIIDGKPYCQDCAPKSASASGKTLQVPPGPRPAGPPASSPGGSSGGTRIPIRTGQGTTTYTPQRSPSGKSSAPTVQPLNPELRVETSLLRQKIKVATGSGAVWVDGGYAISRKGTYRDEETGLGIAPALVEGADGTLRIDESRWTLTHLPTGMKIAPIDVEGEPPIFYQTPTEAQQLASILAQLDWRPEDPAARFSPELKARIGQTIVYYNRALGEARAMMGQDEPTAAAPLTAVESDGEESAAEELLYDKVYSTGHKHGFSEGYDDGVNAALEALGRLDLVETDVDEARIDEVAEDMDELSMLIPADEVDVYEHIYEGAKDEGYDEGFEAGYENAASQFGGLPGEGDSD